MASLFLSKAKGKIFNMPSQKFGNMLYREEIVFTESIQGKRTSHQVKWIFFFFLKGSLKSLL